MTRRLGTILHRLGLLIAVLSVLGALAWNASTFTQRQQAQENLKALSPERQHLETALVDPFAAKRTSTKNLKRSLTYGGVLVLGGLIVYFLIVEPNGLARLWQIAKEKLRQWPFPY